MSNRATMRDVAALAGVGLKTVSRVVNGEDGVSKSLVERVQRASEKLGYRHNLAASNLRRGHRTKSVAVLVQDLSNDYSAKLLRAIDDTAREQGVVVFSASLDEEEVRERELVANFVARRVDGLILMPSSPSQAYLQSEMAAGFAVVVVDRAPRDLLVDYVVVDNVEGARNATAHLIAHGHRRIALICDEVSITTARDRRDGYLDALHAAGIPIDESLIRFARTEQDSMVAVEEFLRSPSPPTAFFAARNIATIGAAAVLKAHGLQNTIALIGFDDIPAAALFDPGISTVAQNPSRIGAEATRMLLERLDGSQEAYRGLIIPTTLHVRGSGEIRPSSNSSPRVTAHADVASC
jgi:LacI family transcriptional regulator